METNNKKKGDAEMTTKVQKWGNSLAIRIPKQVASEFDLDKGSDLEIEILDNAIKLTPTKRKPTLEEMMSKITPENQHEPIDWGGKPEGKELW